MPHHIIFTGHVMKTAEMRAQAEDARIAVAQCTRHGITGLTLYFKGNFISALEGPREPLEDILTFYQIEPRMGDVKAILTGEIEDTHFQDYSIGFWNADFSEQVSGTFALDRKSFARTLARIADGEAKILLKTFGRVNGIA